MLMSQNIVQTNEPAPDDEYRRALQQDLQGQPLVNAIFTCLGAASVCWESMEGTGVFQDGRAKAIGDALTEYLATNGYPGSPRLMCWICGDKLDHLGQSHSEATGDGLRREDAIARMQHYARRIALGDASTAGGSMDLDYAHDELTRAVREYLDLPNADRVIEQLKAEYARAGILGANENSTHDAIAEASLLVLVRAGLMRQLARAAQQEAAQQEASGVDG